MEALSQNGDNWNDTDYWETFFKENTQCKDLGWLDILLNKIKELGEDPTILKIDGDLKEVNKVFLSR